MTLSLRSIDDCIITVHDVEILAVYESQKKFQECPLLNVSCAIKDKEDIHFENICDIEVF